MPIKNPAVMVVEDEAAVLAALSQKLKTAGREVIACSSGEQALDYLRNLQKLPDLIWLDYYLQDMDGLTFMRTIKANAEWADVPIMVMSHSLSAKSDQTLPGADTRPYARTDERRLSEIANLIDEFLQEAAIATAG